MSKETHFRYFTSTNIDHQEAETPRGPKSAANGDIKYGRLIERAATDAEQLGAVRVRVKAGNQCVAPARSKPKRRQTVHDQSDKDSGTGSTIEWSEQLYSVRQIAELLGGQLPVIVKLTTSCQTAGLTKGQVRQLAKGLNVEVTLSSCLKHCCRSIDSFTAVLHFFLF
jgi:hypothetical protein